LGAAFALGNDGRVTQPEEHEVQGADAVAEDAEHLSWAERPPTRRSLVMSGAGLVTALLFAVLAVAPSPYAIGRPGPTYDTLSVVGDTPLVSISGAPTYPTTGELRLTTVSESRGGSQVFTVGQVIAAYFSRQATVLPEEAVFGTPADRDQQQDASSQEWITSQESATVAALEALGTTVPATLTVVSVDAASHATGILEAGDVLLAADGGDLVGYNDLAAAVARHEAGQTLALTIERAGVTRDVDVTLLASDDGRPLIGILVDPTFDLPVDVHVAIDSVGGPSGGTMFALAIMDLLTPQDELQGAKVAGTGTIDISGAVGPIGGIRLKMVGAANDGARYFLAPTSNCGEVVGHIPAGLDVYAVSTLDEAYAAIQAIGQQHTAGLATCANP